MRSDDSRETKEEKEINQMQPRIMLVDDEVIALKRLRRLVEKNGYGVSSYTDALGALRQMKSTHYDLVVTDIKMEGMDGMELMINVKTHFPDTEVILMTGYATIESAIEATREGAFSYLEKPFTPDQFMEKIAEALEHQRLRREAMQGADACHSHAPASNTPDSDPSSSAFTGAFQAPVIIGESRKIREIEALIHQIAPTNCNVLISGDSGTGKELVAKSVHVYSDRSDGPFVAVNCAALSETLLESELFGHEKGAFTGAVKSRVGLLEMADKGTVFFDEVGDMPLSMQVKLLRVLQEKELIRVGGNRPVPVDIRVLSATAKNLKAEVAATTFRKDLYYRINVVNIQLPALSERVEDLPLLIYHILGRLHQKGAKRIEGVSSKAMALLTGYAFPGNVRELENILEHAAAITHSREIRACDLPPDLAELELQTYQIPEDYMMTLAELERDYIAHLLEVTNHAKSKTADILGINRASLWRKIKKYDLE